MGEELYYPRASVMTISLYRSCLCTMVCLILFVQLFSNATQTEQQIEVNLCHDNSPKKEYAIMPPKQCTKHKLDRVKYCGASIHRLTSAYTNITIYSCRVTKTTYISTYYFFGSKNEHVKSLVDKPPSPIACHSWLYSKHAVDIGSLVEKSKNIWTTNNKLHIEYFWPKTHTGYIKNAILTKSIAFFDHTKRKLTGSIQSLSNCNTQAGFCHLGDQMLIWDIPALIDCPKYDTEYTLLAIHLNSDDEIYRLEFPKLGISINNYAKCGDYVSKCFKTDVFCSTETLLFSTTHCVYINASDYVKNIYPRAKFEHTLSDANSLEILGYVQQTQDSLTEVIKNLTSDLHYLECQLENIFAKTYHILSLQYPSEILSDLLGIQTGGLSRGDVILQMNCERRNVTLLRTLEYNGTFASRPLIRIELTNESTVIGQMSYNNVAHMGIYFKENFVEGRVSTFRINEKFYNYINYTLVSQNAHVNMLTPTLQRFNESVEPTQFTELFEEIPRDRKGFSDYDSVLMTISRINQIDMFNDEIENDYDNNNENVDFTYASSYAKRAIKDTFVNALSFIETPFLTFVYSVLFHISLAWGLILTILTIKKFLPFLKNHAFKTYNRIQNYRLNRQIAQTESSRDEELNVYQRPKPTAPPQRNIYPDLKE